MNIKACHTDYHGRMIPLRAHLNKECAANSNATEKYDALCRQCFRSRNASQSSKRVEKWIWEEDMMSLKKHSVFCLEPEGDWPTRQSLVQDILQVHLDSNSFSNIFAAKYI